MKKLSEREAAVLRVLLKDMPHGSTGQDIVHGLYQEGVGAVPRDIPVNGVHRTAASLCRKNLAWRAGTSKLQFYKITQTGRDVLAGTSTRWRIP